MDTWLLVLALCSLLLNIILIARLVQVGRVISRLTAALADIRKTGLKRRFHLGFTGKPLERLGTELNVLMDGFQGTLEEKQKLERSHKQLISNISHDIRTPLTSLLGYVEVLKKQEIQPEERGEYLEIIDAKARSMHRMIEDFFSLARLEAEDAIVALEPVDLTEIVRETVATFYQDFIRASITPEIMLPEAPAAVWGNRAGIERVLGNLLSNALKYGCDGGEIRISMREDEARVWVDVLDRGRGIPENELPRVFDRLYTAEPSRNAAMRGAGLGLAIAKQLIEKQNGEITAESTPGEKTVFSFFLNKITS